MSEVPAVYLGRIEATISAVGLPIRTGLTEDERTAGLPIQAELVRLLGLTDGVMALAEPAAQ